MSETHDQHAHKHYALLFRGERLAGVIGRLLRSKRAAIAHRVRLFGHWPDVSALRNGWLVYIIASLADLDDEELTLARRFKASDKRYLLFSNDLGPESISEYTAELDVRSPRRIHTPRLEADTYLTFCSRLVTSLDSSGADQAILDAWWELDRFVLISADFQRLKVHLDALPSRLRTASHAQRAHYQIDEDGDQVYWPDLDVHVGWPQFQQAVDPVSRIRAQQKDARFNKAYGAAIRELREFRGLTQSDIRGLDERTVRRIEQGRTRATSNSLEKLAAASGVKTNEYLAELAKRLI